MASTCHICYVFQDLQNSFRCPSAQNGRKPLHVKKLNYEKALAEWAEQRIAALSEAAPTGLQAQPRLPQAQPTVQPTAPRALARSPQTLPAAPRAQLPAHTAELATCFAKSILKCCTVLQDEEDAEWINNDYNHNEDDDNDHISDRADTDRLRCTHTGCKYLTRTAYSAPGRAENLLRGHERKQYSFKPTICCLSRFNTHFELNIIENKHTMLVSVTVPIFWLRSAAIFKLNMTSRLTAIASKILSS